MWALLYFPSEQFGFRGGIFSQTLTRESGHDGEITCLGVEVVEERAREDSVSASTAGADFPGASTAIIVTGSEVGAIRVWDVFKRPRV